MRCLLLAIFLVIAKGVLAQVNNPEFTAIAKKFESGKFVSALESAEELIDNDAHRKKPEPYLWAAMCFLELSRSEDPKIQESYKLAVKDALKYAGKAASKDKNGNIVSNNQEFFDELKKAGVELSLYYEEQSEWRKSSYTYKQVLLFAPNDMNIIFMKAIMDIRLNSLTEADGSMRECFPTLTDSYKNLDFKPDPVSAPLLKEGVKFYIDHLVQNMLVDSARSVAFSAKLFFPLDEGINKRFEDLK